jgi:hypothetical protein
LYWKVISAKQTTTKPVRKTPKPSKKGLFNAFNYCIEIKYGISDSALNNVIKRFSVQKIKRGKFTYIPKTFIDKILS